MASVLPKHEVVKKLHDEWIASGYKTIGEFARRTGRSQKTVKRHIEQYRSAEPTIQAVTEASTHNMIFAIGDLHAPFMHQDAVAFLTAAKAKFNPDAVVFLGDELDQHALSQYDSDPDGYSAGHELNAGLEQINPLYTIFKNAKVCKSNHGIRPFKKAYQAGIPKALMKSYKEFMGCPVTWDWHDRIEIGEWVFEHGEGVSGQMGAMKKAMSNMKSTAIGHLHGDAGILIFNNGFKTIYALNAGCLIDEEAYAFAYGKTHARKPVIGLGVIDHGIPHFYPMIVDKHNRWVGTI